MSHLNTIERRQTLPADDGWDDAAAEAGERMIKGQILKFADWRWTAGKEAIPVADGTRLAALATAAMWVRWEGRKPVEYRVRQPGQRLPYREELRRDDEDKWEIGPSGQPIDPWRNTRLVYLVDPSTAEAFTFSTSASGGRSAVNDLGDQIARMRGARRDATPIVELRSAEMKTRFGRKSKPVFKVVDWKTATAGDAERSRSAALPRATERDDYASRRDIVMPARALPPALNEAPPVEVNDYDPDREPFDVKIDGESHGPIDDDIPF